MADDGVPTWLHEEEEHDDEASFEQEQGSPATIFLVDCRKAMLEMHDPSGESEYDMSGQKKPAYSLLQTSLDAVAQFYKDSVVTNDKRKIGLCLYGTAKKDNENDFSNVVDIPDAAAIKEIQNLIKEDSPKLEEYGHIESTVEFYQALWVCSSMFSKASGTNKSRGKQIMVLTCDDNPVGDDDSQLQQALQKSRDLEGLNINLEIFPVVPKAAEDLFDHDKFYNKLLSEMGQEEIEKGEASELWELYEEIKNKYAKQRAARALPMRFGGAEGMEIGVELYSLMKPATKPAAQQITASTHREVKAETNYYSQLTGSDLPADVLGGSHRFAGTTAMFTNEELDSIKQLGSGGHGIEVLGFRSKDFVKKEYQLRPNYFLRPTDAYTKGSVQSFASLWGRLHARGMVAIAAVRPMVKSQPRLAALIPQKRDEKNPGSTQDGFLLMYLPFKDDMRDPDPGNIEGLGQEVDAEALKAGRNMLRCFERLGRGHSFYNTGVQRFYAHLEAHALAQDEPRAVQDSLVPRLSELDQSTSGFIHTLVERLYQPHGTDAIAYNPDDNQTLGAKKPADKDKPAVKPKRKAAEAIDTSGVDWAGKLEGGTLGKMKVAELKAYCGANGLAVSGKKADLLERITSHLESNNGCSAAPSAVKKQKASDGDQGGEEDERSLLCPSAGAMDLDDAPPAAMSDEPAGGGKPMCEYGLKCYRKNPKHFEEYAHPPGHPRANG